MHAPCTRHLVLAVACLALLAPPTTAPAADSPTQPPEAPAWKLSLRNEATAAGFRHRTLDADGGHTQIGDINGDGRADIVLHQPQLLCWLEYPGFDQRLIRRGTLTGKQGTFSGDRFAVADMDGDGDLDVVSGKGREETNYQICWYENPGRNRTTAEAEWAEHVIGAQGSYIKDLMIADLNRDGRPDVVARTQPYTQIYFQPKRGDWRMRRIDHPTKEGMALGDLDQDGDIDIVLNGFWLETPADAEKGNYVQHTIAERWFNQSTGMWTDNCCSVAVGDVDGDGLPDVVLSHSEQTGWPIAWYKVRSREQARSGPWEEHLVTPRFDWCESLQLGDVDGDGALDVMAAEFERPPNKNPILANAAPHPIAIFLNESRDGSRWTPRRVGETGGYAAMLGDVGSDGDLDIVTPRTYFKGPVDFWENPGTARKTVVPLARGITGGRTAGDRHALDRWTYIQVDDTRSKKFFGLAMADVTGDGFKDIAAGQWFYRNPGGDMTAKWDRVALPEGVDAIAIVEVNGNDRGDIIALKPNAQYWLEAVDREGRAWKSHPIGSLPIDDHKLGSQLYAVAQIVPGGKPEIVIGAGSSTWVLHIPANPMAGPWPATQVTAEGTGNGIGDIDGDGWLDIVGSLRGDGEGDPLPGSRGARKDNHAVRWWKNPGAAGGKWKQFDVGFATGADRFVVGDLNGDGRADIAISDERFPGDVPNANLQWYENPGDSQRPWIRHLVATQMSMNSLDLADMDGDGDLDLVTGEHRARPGGAPAVPDNERIQIWENDGKGRFTCRTVDIGKESHLGARVADLDGDGDLDIVSIAWRNFQFLHVWRNDAVR